jgi:CRP-like cAMP-binding protein
MGATTHLLPDLLSGVAQADAAEILALGRPVHLATGEALFRLGEPADRLFLVVRGRVALTLPMRLRGGEENVLVEERIPGETLGWSALVPPNRFTANASASVPSDLLALPQAALLDHLASRPELGFRVSLNVAAVIGHRLQVFQAMWLREMQRVVELRHA